MSGPRFVGKDTISSVIGRDRSCGLIPVMPYVAGHPDDTGYMPDNCHVVSGSRYAEIIRSEEFLVNFTLGVFFYGIKKDEVESALHKGHALIVVDVNSAFSIKEKVPDSVLIFIQPPGGDIKILKKRFKERCGVRTDYTCNIDQAKPDMDKASEFDHVFENRDGQVKAVVKQILGLLPVSAAH